MQAKAFPDTGTAAPTDARTMTDAQFAAAVRHRAWRDGLAAKPPADTAPSGSWPAAQHGSGRSSGTAPAPPPDAGATGKPYAMTLSDADFARAMKERRWRQGRPVR